MVTVDVNVIKSISQSVQCVCVCVYVCVCVFYIVLLEPLLKSTLCVRFLLNC